MLHPVQTEQPFFTSRTVRVARPSDKPVGGMTPLDQLGADRVQFSGKAQPPALESALNISPGQQALLNRLHASVDEIVENRFPLADVKAQVLKNDTLFNEASPDPRTDLQAAARLDKLARYAQEAAYLQSLDENFVPPLEMLQQLVQRGINVVGVPVPPLDGANALMQDARFNQILKNTLPDAQYRDIQQMAARQNLMDTSLPNVVGREGYAMAQTLTGIEMSRRVSVGVSTFLGVNNGLAAEAIAKLGTPEQQAFWLNAMAQGKLTFAFGLTGPEAGSDPRSMTTTFQRTQDPQTGETKYRLNGSKKFIGNAARVVNPATGEVIHRGADYIVIFAVDDPKKGPEARSFRAFLVPRTAIGEENIRPTGGEHHKLGLNEVNNGDFDLINVDAPESLMLGTDKDIFPELRKMLDETRQFVGTMGLGATVKLLDNARAFAGQRIVNKRPIIEYPAVREPLDILSAKALAGRLLLMDAARKIDEAAKQRANGEPPIIFTNDTSMAKLYCTELANETARAVKNTLGGVGYLKDPYQNFGVEKLLRDVAVTEIYEGQSNIQRMLISGGVLITERKALAAKMAKIPGIGRPREKSDAQPSRTPVSKPSAFKRLKKTMQQKGIQVYLKSRIGKSEGILQNGEFISAHAAIEHAYLYTANDCLLRVNVERERLAEEWKAEGIPARYQGWDAKSLDRQLDMEVMTRWQGRLFIMADLAMNFHLAKLAQRQLDALDQKAGRLSADEREQVLLLTLFMDHAKLTALNKYQEYRSGLRERLDSAQETIHNGNGINAGQR